MKHILVDKFNEINIELNDTQIEQFEKYYELLIEWNNVMNLTAITEKEDVVIKHFVDSVSICLFNDFNFNEKVLNRWKI